MKPALRSVLAATVAIVLLAAATTHADEGMWTYDNFPIAALQQQHGVSLSPQWLDHVRLATVRLAGCTASFVSEEGLLLTNHHCVASCLAQLSTPAHDLLQEGFLADAREQELRCPTQHADVLVRMEDVTAQVTAATQGLPDREAGEARRQALLRLEQACEAAAAADDPRHCESVSLYQGGQHFLYHYRRYEDVRLAFAPEAAIAAFGGDADNFQFPRWCLDMALLRAWDQHGPARTPEHLKVDWSGPAEGETVFVTGHPGTTNRLLTAAQLETQRALAPLALLRASELRGRYIQYAKTGAEAARIVADPLNGLENGLKVRRRQLDALLDPALLAGKREAEARLRQRTVSATGEDPWADIAVAMQREQELAVPYTFIEGGAGFDSVLFRHARALVRAAAEREKPSEQRLREYADTALPALARRLTADVPVYADLERLTLSASVERMREYLGPDHPLVQVLLAEFSPDTLAAALVAGSQLADPAVRRQLWEGGQAAIEATSDPMIRIARLVDQPARALRRQHEDEVEAIVDAAQEKIASARFAAFGTGIYPDATFTLRLNYGIVRGWTEAGTPVAPFSRLDRAFARATADAPLRLPESWASRRMQLDGSTAFNLVTDNDIVGGNSGSPLVNAGGEIVGLVFDGNIHAISGSYWFDAARNRAVAVHPAIMRTALVQVYNARRLGGELGLVFE